MIPLSRRLSSRQARASGADARNNIGAAGLGGIFRNNANIGSVAISEVAAELLALSKTAVNVAGAHGAEAVVGVARVLGRALLAAGHLGQEGTALDGVDEDVAGLEHGVRGPGAEHLGDAAAGLGVVLGVDVEECHLADAVAGGVLGDRRDVVHAETRGVGRLVDETVLDVEVVVNRGDRS